MAHSPSTIIYNLSSSGDWQDVTCPKCGSDYLQYAEEQIAYYGLSCYAHTHHRPGLPDRTSIQLECDDLIDSNASGSGNDHIYCPDCGEEFSWKEVEDHMQEKYDKARMKSE